jgi:hypothetical protein
MGSAVALEPDLDEPNLPTDLLMSHALHLLPFDALYTDPI